MVDGYPRRLRSTLVPERDFADAHLFLLSGTSAGQSVPVATIDGATIGFAFAANQAVIKSIRPGDQLRIDNAWPLALQAYHPHQVPRSGCATFRS
jgi:hypothetical protein